MTPTRARGFGTALVLLAAAAWLGTACNSTEPLMTKEPTSLKVIVIDPVDLGAQQRPIEQRSLTFQVQAYLSTGVVAQNFSAVLNVLVFSEGNLSRLPLNPALTPAGCADPTTAASQPPGTCPVTYQIALINGTTDLITLDLPSTFEQTALWVEDTGNDLATGTFATGTSEAIFYPNPKFSDINRPVDETTAAVTFHSQLEGKTVYVDGTLTGTLVVTGVYNQFFTATDIDPNEMAKGYNHLLPFSFSAPRYHRNINGSNYSFALSIGQRLSYVQGGVSEFNGLTELGFPTFDVLDDDVDPATGNPITHPELIPEPVELMPGDFQQPPGDAATQDKLIKFEKQEGGLVSVSGGVMCPIPPYDCQNECAPCNVQGVCFNALPLATQNFCSAVRMPADPNWPTEKDYCSDCQSYYQFGQWKIKPDGGDCKYNAVNVVTSGQVPFDAVTAAAKAQSMNRIVGTMSNVSGVSSCTGNDFNIWIIKPRLPTDVSCNPDPCPGAGAVSQ
jgi:hypothetical protein